MSTSSNSGIHYVELTFKDAQLGIRFYTIVLEPLGYKNLFSYPERVGFGPKDDAVFWVRELKNGEENITHGKVMPTRFAFTCDERKKVDEIYLVALKTGGKDNGVPAFHKDYAHGHYTASIIDPEGNIFDLIAQ